MSQLIKLKQIAGGVELQSDVSNLKNWLDYSASELTEKGSAATRLGNLETKVGDSSVDSQIDSALGALSFTDPTAEALSGTTVTYVDSVTQADGQITATRKTLTSANIAYGADSNVSAELARLESAKQDNVGFVGANEDGLGNAAYDASTNKVATKDFVEKYVASYTTSAMHFRGVVSATSDITDPEAGDIVIVGNKEYVYDAGAAGRDAGWKELGDETIYLTTSAFQSYQEIIGYNAKIDNKTLYEQVTSGDTAVTNALTGTASDLTTALTLNGLNNKIDAISTDNKGIAISSADQITLNLADKTNAVVADAANNKEVANVGLDANGNLAVQVSAGAKITVATSDDDVVNLTGGNDDAFGKVVISASHATSGVVSGAETSKSTGNNAAATVSVSDSNETGTLTVKVPDITVNKYGHVTSLAEKEFSIGVDLTGYQPEDAQLTALAALDGTTAGFVKQGANGSYSIDTTTYVDAAATDYVKTVSTKDGALATSANNVTIPEATGSVSGTVTLSDATNSESSTNGGVAATPAAVKAVKDALEGNLSDLVDGLTVADGTVATTKKVTLGSAAANKTLDNILVNGSTLQAGDLSGSIASGVTLAKTTPTVGAEPASKDYVDTAVAGLSGAMHFKGVSTTAVTDGGTETATIGGEALTAEAGDVVLYQQKEYVWTGSAWEELGDESSFALKTTEINGHALSSNVTLTNSDIGLGNVTNDAQVKKAASSVDGEVVVWSGTTGDTVVGSGKTLAKSVPANANFKNYEAGADIDISVKTGESGEDATYVIKVDNSVTANSANATFQKFAVDAQGLVTDVKAVATSDITGLLNFQDKSTGAAGMSSTNGIALKDYVDEEIADAISDMTSDSEYVVTHALTSEAVAANTAKAWTLVPGAGKTTKGGLVKLYINGMVYFTNIDAGATSASYTLPFAVEADDDLYIEFIVKNA